MSALTLFDTTAVAISTVSPYFSITAPEACIAKFPVSIVSFFPANSVSKTLLPFTIELISSSLSCPLNFLQNKILAGLPIFRR